MKLMWRWAEPVADGKPPFSLRVFPTEPMTCHNALDIPAGDDRPKHSREIIRKAPNRNDQD